MKYVFISHWAWAVPVRQLFKWEGMRLISSHVIKEHRINTSSITIGHVNNIPTLQFFTGISRNTQSKLICYNWLNMSGSPEIMHWWIFINIPYCSINTGQIHIHVRVSDWWTSHGTDTSLIEVEAHSFKIIIVIIVIIVIIFTDAL